MPSLSARRLVNSHTVTEPGTRLRQIGAVAEAVGLSIRTIRHYEEVGLVPPSGRSAGGFRLYTDDDIDRLRLIKQMKPLDFTLEEMADVFHTLHQARTTTNPKHAHQAHERLAMYAAAADARCDKLREQLHAAETMAHMLRNHAHT